MLMTTPIEQTKYHDVTVTRREKTGSARVLGVPPEEFGIEPYARNIRDSNYCFHDIVTNTEADLIDQGYDAQQIKKLPTYTAAATSEGQRRDSVDESQRQSADSSGTRIVKVTEHYVRMDYEGKGDVCLYRVTTGGNEGEVLIRDGKPDIIKFDAMPFAAMTPVIITHRFYGRSLADLVMDIQRIKTALIRGALDNLYLALNRRTEVSESHASENTLDDLLVSRPSGIVRTKMPGGLREIEHTDVGGQVYPMMEYMDGTREWRTGVTKQGQGIDANALQNQSATAVNQAFTASQARVRLIARIFAETGIRDLFWLLHATVRKHADQQSVVRLRNKWITVDPRNWKARNDLTVSVGLGTGSKSERLAHLTMLAGAQEKLVLAGKSNIVDDAKLYNTAKEITKALSLPNVDAFFNNPEEKDEQTGQLKYPPPPPQTDPEMVKAQAAMQQNQQKAQLEQQKSDNDTKQQVAQAQADIALAERKFQLDKELAQFQANLDMQKHYMDMTAKAMSMAGQKNEDGSPSMDMGQMMEMMRSMHPPQQNKPMRIVRDQMGRVSHLEPMNG